MMEPARRDLIETLVLLVRESRYGTCWDSERAEDLLRHQSSVEELESLGVDRKLIDAVWGH